MRSTAQLLVLSCWYSFGLNHYTNPSAFVLNTLNIQLLRLGSTQRTRLFAKKSTVNFYRVFNPVSKVQNCKIKNYINLAGKIKTSSHRSKHTTISSNNYRGTSGKIFCAYSDGSEIKKPVHKEQEDCGSTPRI